MDGEKYTEPDTLEKYAFLWSEARLVVAALALLLGGIPPALYFLPVPALYGIVVLALKVAWLISGVASLYLAYRWYTNDRKVFGGNERRDMASFVISIVSGINLGVTGLLSSNIGMSLTSSRVIYIIVAILYIASAIHLWRRWKESDERLFD